MRNARGVGHDVDGLGKGIVEVKLHTVFHPVAEVDLQSMIVGVRI